MFVLFAAGLTAAAQESPTPQPSPSPRTVRISFLPPPIEGTISLGIYDAKGKLIRVLHREAELEDFTIGNDALSTTWDGKDDAGQDLPAGKYHARGYAVGDVEVDGVGFFFNDWVTEENSPRITRISAIAAENGAPVLTAKTNSDSPLTITCDGNGKIVALGEERAHSAACHAEADPPQLIDPIACDVGKDGTRWIIDQVAVSPPQSEVKQFSSGKELLRRLKLSPQEPQPRQVAAAKDADTIFLLEENEAMQRLRGLTLLATASGEEGSISDWKVVFEKKIVVHKDFTIENGKPVIAGGKTPPEKILIRLKANPLKNDGKENLELAAGFDARGSFLKTVDGLPLQSISETPHLTRIVLSASSENSVNVFQDDDAVVEQFRLSGLDQMMAFDCGDFELK